MPQVSKTIDNLFLSMEKELNEIVESVIDEFIDTIPKYEMIEHSVKEYAKDNSFYEHHIYAYTLIKNTRKQVTKGFLSVDKSLPFHIQNKISRHNEVILKRVQKNKAKEEVTTKFKVGDIIVLRGKIKNGSNRLVKTFEVKKIIWTIRSQIVNALVLKQLTGPNNNRSLTKDDCVKYHIKYEPGLQVYPMNLGFSKRKYIGNSEISK